MTRVEVASQLLKVEEVAARLSLSVDHTYRLIERGDLERVKIGTSVRVSEGSLAAFIAERTKPARRTRAGAA